MEFLQFFNLTFAKNLMSMRMIILRKLTLTFIKLNVDGASKSNPGEVVAWGLLRDSQGNMILGLPHIWIICFFSLC